MEIFESWLLDFNRQMKTQDKKILLLVDNAGGHNITPDLNKIKRKIEKNIENNLTQETIT